MKTKTIALMTAIFCLCGVARASDSAPLRLYVPRTVPVDANSLTLGTITIIHSTDAELARRASRVAMGRAPFPRESLVIDRRTILSRLASCGIRSDQVKITGAKTVTVRRNETVVRAKEIVEAAEKLLRTRRPGPVGVGWRLTGKVDDLILPTAGGKAELRPKLVKNSSKDRVKVRVAVVRDGEESAARELLFTLLYPHRRAVALTDIPAGAKITQENARIQTVTREAPPRKDFVSPFGSIAAVNVKAGEVIRPNVLSQPKPPIVVQRDQTVVMKIEGPGFKISGFGRSLEDGRPGDVIKVRNIDSRRIVVARVAFDGTVSPILKR